MYVQGLGSRGLDFLTVIINMYVFIYYINNRIFYYIKYYVYYKYIILLYKTLYIINNL